MRNSITIEEWAELIQQGYGIEMNEAKLAKTLGALGYLFSIDEPEMVEYIKDGIYILDGKTPDVTFKGMVAMTEDVVSFIKSL